MMIAAIIAAGGIGSRMGAGASKQLLPLAGSPVVARSASIFQEEPAVSQIIIVIDAADMERCRGDVEAFGLSKVKAVVPGGENRAASVVNGLGALSGGIDTVIVHDGARPLFPREILAGGIAALASGDCDGVVFGIPLTDTVKEVDPDSMDIIGTPDRARLWAAQTPQMFRREILERAYTAPADELAGATDDSSLVEHAGGRIRMVEGSPENIKITTPADLAVAEEILRRRSQA